MVATALGAGPVTSLVVGGGSIYQDSRERSTKDWQSNIFTQNKTMIGFTTKNESRRQEEGSVGCSTLEYGVFHDNGDDVSNVFWITRI